MTQNNVYYTQDVATLLNLNGGYLFQQQSSAPIFNTFTGLIESPQPQPQPLQYVIIPNNVINVTPQLQPQKTPTAGGAAHHDPRLIMEHLFPRIQSIQPHLASKIAGILLESLNGEQLLKLLYDDKDLMD
eukprot:122018_1